MLGPSRHGEQVTIGHGERITHQVGGLGQFTIHPLQARDQACFGDGFGLVGHTGGEQRREAFVQLGADEVEPLLQLVALERAVGRSELLGGHLVGDVLQDGRAFAHLATVVQHQQGHIA